MSLHLDKRQRAMLRELGVRVWQPAEPLAATLIATQRVETPAEPAARTPPVEERPPLTHPTAQPAIESPPLPKTPVLPAVGSASAVPSAWSLGEARALYPTAAPAQGARWLMLAEPFQGDAGKLLDNMLRAARMNQAGAVWFAPLVRRAASGASPDLSAALSALVTQTRPDLVLVMGRLAAQAVLQSTEPFGKLRGQVHRLHGANTLVTYDAHYLLHRPADKAKAWDDLCLAMSLAHRD